MQAVGFAARIRWRKVNKFVIARRPKADVAISGRHYQFVQGIDKMVSTNCVCSGAH